MVLIVTGSRTTAKTVGLAVKGRREVFVPTGPAFDWRGRLLQVIGEQRPSVILLDARCGNSQVRAVDLLRWMQQASPLSSIVVLTYSPTPEELQEIADMGAYSWVDLDARPTVSERLRAVVWSASRRSPRRASGLLH